MPPPRASRPSRADMLMSGVPEDYIDALLDEKYMEDLIAATNKQNLKREKKRNREDRLQKVILVFLICQAVLGVVVALYKTYLQPDKIISAFVTMENIDMVLMMDTSNHMKERRDQQQDVVLRFSEDMHHAMKQQRDQTLRENVERVEAIKRKQTTAFSRFLSHFISTKEQEDNTGLSGGRLRFATGIFNRNSKTLHKFTTNLTIQEKAVNTVTKDQYESFTHMKEAMGNCVEIFAQANKPNTRKYCVIIGDNEAMCKKPETKNVDALAQQAHIAHLFPEGFLEVGATLEYSKEFDKCKDYVADSFNDIQLIMMFTVSSKEDERVRLRNPTFRNFVQNTTGCEFAMDTEMQGGAPVVIYEPKAENCTRFILGRGLEDVLQKSKSLVQLLQASSKDWEEPNTQKDNRYLFFLLMPLNLIFFFAASAIARWYERFRLKAARVMGKKKKMIKVTKTLVEKEKRKSVVTRFAALHTEVELAEVKKKLQPLVKLNSPMTLRARLKGGCLRSNVQQSVADGNGTAFDPNAFWNFEPLEGTEGLNPDAVMQAGQPVHIRNNKGELLCIGAEGKTKFVAPSEASLATQFVVSPTTGDDDAAKLGENVRILSKQTGQYLRVKKDGTCDAVGSSKETETQFVIDQGGQPTTTGAIFTFRAEVSQDALLNGNPNGSVQVASAGTWSHWLVEKTGSTSNSDSKADAQHLRIGDIVTLKALNGQHLQVDSGSRVAHTGDPTAELTSAIPENVPSSSSSAGVQEFIIERVGMGPVNLHDLTIRKGANICLKPYDSSGAADALQYLKVNMNGAITANGKATDREIGFVMEGGSVNQLLTPLGNALFQGDVDLLVAPLWNKSDFKHHDAMSSSWTHDEELSKFKGHVVVASEQGGYTVPKAAGEGKAEWVAVVNEGVDLRKAAAQAKKQGATGLIIRCEQALSVEKLAACAEGEVPELPAVFVTKKVGEALNERGIVLRGCEFRKKYMTEVMRTLGRLGAGGPTGEKYKNLFEAVGNAIIQEEREKARAPKPVQKVTVQTAPDSQQGKFKWKVNTNTAYIWSGSGGGATTMQVNYGEKAPPSAMKQKMVEGEDGQETSHVDASADIVPQNSTPDFGRRSVVGSAMVPAEDFKAHHLAEKLTEVLLEDSSAAQQQAAMEQLSDESDFMIEYSFAEVDVPVTGKDEELDEDEEVMEEGTVVASVGVPRRYFWIVAAFLLLTTTALAYVVHANMSAEMKLPEEFQKRLDEEEEETFMGLPDLLAPIRSLLAVH
ncbi:unnamed protein product [Cladocopium goreaui]|uniref:PA domain-containing protein n=1 Tax=Cladocopium goreaui TaxID=2562237 RepID=A0A9P1FNP7_9DINO|nr:unnamed protein product [Cladocopium goreaui]